MMQSVYLQRITEKTMFPQPKKQTQFKPNQTQFQRQKNAAFDDDW